MRGRGRAERTDRPLLGHGVVGVALDAAKGLRGRHDTRDKDAPTPSHDKTRRTMTRDPEKDLRSRAFQKRSATKHASTAAMESFLGRRPASGAGAGEDAGGPESAGRLGGAGARGLAR